MLSGLAEPPIASPVPRSNLLFTMRLAVLFLLLLALPLSAAEAKTKGKPVGEADPGRARRTQVITQQLLQYFTIGIQASPEWVIETRAEQGDRFACMAGYLSHAADSTDPWFFKYGALKAKFEGSRRAKVICWNTWYGLAEAPPANYQPTPAAATPVNAKVSSTMLTYWTNVRKFMQLAAEYQDVDCVMQIEPDEWGHLLLSCGFDFNKPGVILVGGSGLPELAGLPDTVSGWAQGFRRLRDSIAPHVILAANPSAWDRNGSMSGERWGTYFKSMGITPEGGWDLFITQLHDWDRGQESNGSNAKYPPYTEADTVDYHGSVDNWCAWIKPIHEATGMWAVAWQLPQGNWTYATCDGSDGHAMDNVTELLLEDYPRNQTAAKMAAAGCAMWIFSLGGNGANVDDAKKDGITNPTPHTGNKGLKSVFADDDGGYLRLKSAIYFKNPVMILGAAAKGEKAEKPKKPVVAKAPPPPPQKLADPTQRAVWTAKLQTLVRAEIVARREPQFTLAVLHSTATLRDLAADQTMTLAIAGSGELTMPWSRLTDADLAQLAVAMQRGDDADRRALAGFFLLLNGDATAAEDQLRRAGTQAADVERLFAP